MANAAATLALLEWRGIPALRLGEVGGDTLTITANGKEISWELDELKGAFLDTIGSLMES